MLLVGMGGAGRVGGLSSALLRCIVGMVGVVGVVGVVGMVGVVGVVGVVVGVEVVGDVSPCGCTAKQFCWGQSIIDSVGLLVVSSGTCVGRQKRQMSIAVAVGGLWTVPAGVSSPLHICFATAEKKPAVFKFCQDEGIESNCELPKIFGQNPVL